MLLAMNKDIRVIFIKLCDRLHNMRTLEAKREDRQRAIALETMYIYAPLAHRLGIQRIKHEPENISLYYLDRVGYDEVQESIEKKYGLNIGFIEEAKQILKYDEEVALYERRIKELESQLAQKDEQLKTFLEQF